MYTLLEILNIALRFESENTEKDESILFCLESTLLTLLFQSNIFRSFYINIIISIKHISLWFLINPELKSPKNVTSVMVCIVILSVWIIFEKDKRSYLLSAYKAKKNKSKTLAELSNLLQIFPQGLLIIDHELNIQYKNELIKGIIGQADPINFLSTNFNQGSKISILDQIQENNLIQKSVSLGISTINGLRYEWSVKTITWEKGLSYMVTVQDVTTILNFERISASNKTKTEIIRSISHGLRTPINGIHLVLEELWNEMSENLKKKMLQIKTCTKLLEFQINDILDYSDICAKRFKLNYSKFDLKSVLSDCFEYIKVQAEYKNILLDFEFGADLPIEIWTDKDRLQKVIMNLLNNSIQFTHKGSIVFSVNKVPQGVKFSVKDSGIGISTENLEKIFKVGDSKVLNKGIGLYICKKVLKFLNSSFDIISNPDTGSVFSFTIASLQDDSKTPTLKLPNKLIFSNELINTSAKDCKDIANSQPYPRVLVVDDNVFNRMFLTIALNKKGILYYEAQNGQEAVDIVMSADLNAKSIDCIVMDCSMPVMDGWEASRRIRKLAENGEIKKMPAIFAHSAYSSEDDIKLCFEAGMIDYIQKPTSAEEIIIKISKFLTD